MLLLLALAFANPFVNRTSVVAAGRRMRVLAIDRSFSMRAGDRMEQARNARANCCNRRQVRS